MAKETCGLQGILQTDPTRRWTPWQALQHPFITDKPFTDTFVPPEEPPEVRPMLRQSLRQSMPRAVPSGHRSAAAAGHVGSAQHAGATVSPHGLSPYQHVQISPFQAPATNGAFAMSVTGSDSLPRAYVAAAEGRGYGSDSGGLLDRSGTIPASAFPMLGSSVGLGNTSTLSMFQARPSPQPQACVSTAGLTGEPCCGPAADVPHSHCRETRRRYPAP